MVFISSIDDKVVTVNEMMLEVDNEILRLDSLVVAACIAGKNIVLIFTSGEMRIYGLDLRLLASRQVAIPDEWALVSPPLLAANRSGSYIAIGLTGGALVLYSFEKELKAVGTLRVPPMVKAVNLITLPANKLPIVWMFSSCVEKNTSFVKLEPSPLSTGDFVAIRLPLQGSPDLALTLDSKEGESIAIYDDQIRYFSMQDIVSGRTALKAFSIGKTTAWSIASGMAYFIARSTLYSLNVFDGKVNMDPIVTDPHHVDLGQIKQFTVVSKQGKLTVDYCTDLERGYFSVENAEIKDHKIRLWGCKDFQLNGKSNKLILTTKEASLLAFVHQASSADIIAEYKELCPPFLTGLHYIEEIQLLLVSSVSTCWMYLLKGGEVRPMATLDEPVIAAGLVHGSVLVVTATGVAALNPFPPFRSIVQQEYPIFQAHVGFGICAVILETNEILVLDPELVEQPRKINPAGGMVYFVKVIDPKTIAVGLEHELRLYDADLLKVKQSVQSENAVTDCIMDKELVFSTTAGDVYFGNSRQNISGGSLTLLSAHQKYALIKTDHLYKVDSNGVIPVHFGQRSVPDRVKSVCKISKNDFMVGLDNNLLRVRLDGLPTSVMPRSNTVSTQFPARQFVQAPHVRAVFVLGNRGQILAFDSKYHEPLALTGLPQDLSQDEKPILIHMWNIVLSGHKYYHLIIYSESELTAVLRTYTITRRRHTLTFVARMKKIVPRTICELATGPTSVLFTERKKPASLRVFKIEESDGVLRLGENTSYKLGFEINSIATSGSKVFVACSNSLGLTGIDTDSDSVWTIEYPKVKFERCLVRVTQKETFVIASTDKPELVIFQQKAPQEYKLHQVLAIPHPVAEMRLSHSGVLLLLLKNSDIIEIAVSDESSPVFTIY